MKKNLLLSLIIGIILLPSLSHSARRSGAATSTASKRPSVATTRKAPTRKTFVSSRTVAPEVMDSESALMDHLKQVNDLVSTMAVVSEEAKALIGEINLKVNGPVAMSAMTKPMPSMTKPMPALTMPPADAEMGILPVAEEFTPEGQETT